MPVGPGACSPGYAGHRIRSGLIAPTAPNPAPLLASKHGSTLLNPGAMSRKKPLPEKLCAVCGRAFSWRRKWARDWPNVRYCSERCRRNRRDAEP